jgi:hypothetical protein
MGSSKPVSRKNDLVVQEHDGEILIYDLTDNRALCLNETSARIWRACDGTNSVEDIGRAVGNEDLVWLALAELKKEKLIDHEPVTPDRFAGVSRREAIRRVGMASLIALPVIASLTAPAAAQAGTCTQTSTGCTGSSRPRGCNCSSTSNCLPGLTCNAAVSGGTCC